MDWSKIKHFEREEWEPGAEKIYPSLIDRMNEMRRCCGHPIVIHNAYATTGHSEDSYHYSGMAVDFHIKDCSLLEQFLIAERFGFGGIGLYPFWNSPGLHCDLRYINFRVWQRAARWWKDAKGTYRGFDEDEFKECFGLEYNWENSDWLWQYWRDR